MSVLIDTSSWIHALRRDGDPAARQRVALLLESGEAAWCDMVRLELWNGASGEHERKVLRAFDAELDRLSIDEETWDAALDLARLARTRSITVPSTDLMIYACARRHGVRLEHSDSHYDLLQKLVRAG